MHCGNIGYHKNTLKLSDSIIFGENLKDSLTNPNTEYSNTIESEIAKYLFVKRDMMNKKILNQMLGDNKIAFLRKDGKMDLFGKNWLLRNQLVVSEDIF